MAHRTAGGGCTAHRRDRPCEAAPAAHLEQIGGFRLRRGALAGAVAAAVWAACEPLAGRAFGTRYSDLRLLGAAVCPGPRWRAAGLALHLANGALFGAAFARLGWRGWRRGVAAAEVEGLLAWPAMALADRRHPDRRDGTWPRLLTDRRVFAQEAALHAVFGAVLGLLLGPPRRR
jgi:hypothetical protein